MVDGSDGRAEARIMSAVEKVGKKVDNLTDKFTASEIKTAVAIAKIQQIEATCPINEVEETLREVEKTSDQNKRDMRRISAFIAGVVAAAMGAAHMLFDWFTTKS